MTRLLKFRREVRAVGFGAAWRLALSTAGARVPVTLNGYQVELRARTSDLKVAMESLVSEYAFLDDLLGEDYSGFIIDAGGYVGTAAISMAKRFPRAQIVTIEPSSANFSVLEVNIIPYKNIRAVNAALGVREGDTVTLCNRGTGNWGFTTISRPVDSSMPVEIEKVTTVSIAQLTKEAGRIPGFLKLDIEGGEKAIFDEGGDDLGRIPFVFVELHDRIIEGCKDSFMAFSRNRWVVNTGGEKFLSIAQQTSPRK